MTYAAFRLATHANAALAGRPVLWNILPEFEGGTEWVFLVPGPQGHKLRKEPRAWIETMRGFGVRRAWFSFGPTTGLRREGVMTEGDSHCFYLLSGRKIEEDGHFRATLNGHPAVAEIAAPVDEVAVAARRLREALPPMIAYAEGARRNEFVQTLIDAFALLDGRKEPSLQVRSMFPPGIYPRESVALLAAATKGDVFGNGGMGWWYDTAVRTPGFETLSKSYAAALYPAFVAASRLDLP